MTRAFKSLPFKSMPLATAALSIILLSACASTGTQQSAAKTLYSGIDQTQMQGGSAPSVMLTGSDPTCLQLYKNSAALMSPQAPKKTGIGGQIFRAVALNALAGVAGSGVSMLGIGNPLGQVAASTAATQAAYAGGNAALDKMDKDPVATANAMAEITSAATALGCPAPTEADIRASLAQQVATP